MDHIGIIALILGTPITALLVCSSLQLRLELCLTTHCLDIALTPNLLVCRQRSMATSLQT